MTNESHLFRLTCIQVKDFRCFTEKTIDLDSPVIVICGANGTGKTSLLEALHYGCYLRSFRTYLPRDLITFEKKSFFIKLSVHDNSLGAPLCHTIHIGFNNGKRLVKIDNKTILSYKELLQHYRVVSVTEDDLCLIKGNPQERRTFLDQSLLLYNPSFATKIREFRSVLESRNALLHKGETDDEHYLIWTQQLWEKTHVIQEARKQLLDTFSREINTTLTTYFDGVLSIVLEYSAKKKSDKSYDVFIQKKDDLIREEIRYGRSLFGAHLDDFDIRFEGKKSKTYASRGQQKLGVLLLKAALVKLLTQEKGPTILLLDDFMTDFDPKRASLLLSVLHGLNCQLIFTSPYYDSLLKNLLDIHKIPYKIVTI